MSAFELKKEILQEHTKAQCAKIVNWVGNDPARFDALFHLLLHGEKKEAQRAAWPVGYCVEAHPNLIDKHLAALLKNLDRTDLHDAVRRNSIRLLQFVSIPEKYQGRVMDLCFTYLASPTAAVALKVYSIYVLEKLAVLYPEILPEMKLLIEEQLPHQTPAFKSSVRRLMK